MTFFHEAAEFAPYPSRSLWPDFYAVNYTNYCFNSVFSFL